MKRHSKSAVLDISIPGDQLEQHRIQLEHNLQHTDLSLHLSSSHDDDEQDDDTVEYPRHLSGPSPFHDFNSFDHRSRDNFDSELHSQIHAWSYRTGDGDDEDGISPYGGETVSTAAHHASALTLSAGLGGRGGRREISLSGAEYDPDRPLHNMMAAVDPKLSMFDMDPSRSRYEPVFDSFHSPGRLDRVLQSGHAPPSSRSRSVRIRSPHSSATSSASSDSDSPRPRLADALQRVSFSPKRPRSPQAPHHPNHRHAQVPPSPLTRTIDDTPRPHRRSTPAAAPPTPASQFADAARSLARDIAEEQHHDRNPFTDIANRVEVDATRRSSHSKSRVYLPDVTGLTNAVESPAKAGGGYNAYPYDDRPRDSEARLLSTLSAVQAKLHQLEEENSISRRRVRELELELEVCKREVAQERTRIIEREEASVRQAEHKRTKGKGKARAVNLDDDDDEGDLAERYREAVEEKKALESLISTLRSHLTRLTAELSSHQELLTELRKLRERDNRTMREKSAEVDRLRQEVERLAGEVEVLRGVVEEGLRERRSMRDATVETSQMQSAADVAMSADLDESLEEEERDQEPLDDRSSTEELEDSDSDSEAEPFDPLSILGSSRDNAGGNGTVAPDRTMRTDHATRGSSLNPANTTSGRFIGDEELARIAADVEERRSNASGSSSSHRDRARVPSPPPRQQQPQTRRVTVEEVSDDGTELAGMRAPTPPARAGPSQPRLAQPPPRPPVPTPSRARGHHKKQAAADRPETPFPQIRGEYLERLFFSAPEHNARTCTVCCRRRGPAQPRDPAAWVPSRMEKDFRARMQEAADSEEEDEGFAEGDEDVIARNRKREGKKREPADRERGREINYEAVARKAGLPPQTIVAHVIRELEDDFTHYKSVYCELADQYKEMDAVSDVPKRNLLAKHLREVVDILEQKGDQIASLYECLTFKDNPISKRPGSRS
ncbi:AAA family ATPase [Favolaschia claudopus]|uniref:AAA family ATPase n=1 Tax=Favolaschia claudopus TaxID=2862362 RepID=A0AAW0DAA7_9AGAR